MDQSLFVNPGCAETYLYTQSLWVVYWKFVKVDIIYAAVNTSTVIGVVNAGNCFAYFLFCIMVSIGTDYWYRSVLVVINLLLSISYQ